MLKKRETRQLLYWQDVLSERHDRQNVTVPTYMLTNYLTYNYKELNIGYS